jgi:uncharacterized protein
VILLDTTVLLYAVGGDHPLRQPSITLLQAHAAGTVEAATTDGVLQEFIHGYSRRRDRATSIEIARRYLEAIPLIAPTPSEVEVGLGVYAEHQRVGAFDAVLAGITLGRALRALISSDEAFGDVPGLPWIAPGTPAFEDLVAGDD